MESRRSGSRRCIHLLLLGCSFLLPSTICTSSSSPLTSFPSSTSAPCCISNDGAARPRKRVEYRRLPLSLLDRNACLTLRGGDVEQGSVAQNDDNENLVVGGNGNNNRGDAEIDAYIEQLIASVDDDPVDGSSTDDGTKRTITREAQGDENDQDTDGDAETATQAESESVHSTGSNVALNEELEPVATTVSNGATEVHKAEPGRSSSTHEGTVSIAKQPLAMKSAGDNTPSQPATEEHSVDKVALMTEGKYPLLARPRLPPPNPLYRALLRRKRWGGHIIAMALVTLSELCELWLPGVARMWQNLVWNSLVGSEDRSGGDPRGRPRGAGADDRRPVSARQLESQLRSSKRSGTSRKQLKKLQKHADRAALQVLAHLTKSSKYRYTSLAFQRRHGLGQFGAGASSSSRVESADPAHQGEGAISAALHDSRRVQKKRRPKQADDKSERDADVEEDDDVEWILEALTTSKRSDEALEQGRLASSTRRSQGVRPRVELEVGPSGPSVSLGVDFSLGGGKRAKEANSLESVLRSASRQGRTKRAVSRVVTSDRDSGVLGRIRAVTSDTIGRSLLGAYPGDAAPINDAASPRGVIDLASRYGYGDWSDDDEEEDYHEEGGQKLYRRKRKKRKNDSPSSRPSQSQNARRTKEATGVLGIEFGFAGDGSVERTSRSSTQISGTSARAPSSSLSQKSGSQPSRAHLSKRFEERSTSGQSAITGSRLPESTRPAMDRTDETRHKTLSSNGRGAPIRPAMDLVNELKRRRGAILDDSGE